MCYVYINWIADKWINLHPTCLCKDLRHHMYVLTCKLVWTNNPSMEKVNTGVRVIHLARLNPEWTFSAFSAFMSLPEVKIISDVSMIRKASNRELEFNILPNWTLPLSPLLSVVAWLSCERHIKYRTISSLQFHWQVVQDKLHKIFKNTSDGYHRMAVL